MKDEVITLQFDGGSRGNPGPAAIGVVLSASDGTPLVTLGRPIGRATNNVAEYRALITGLQEAKKLGARRIVIRGDSELIIKQMRGEYRVKHPDMKVLYEQAQDLLGEFDSAKIEHNLRHKNELADKLANLALDRKRDVSDADFAGGAGTARAPSSGSAAADPGTDPEEASAPEPRRGDRLACARCGCVVVIEVPTRLRPHQLRPMMCQCGNTMRPG